MRNVLVALAALLLLPAALLDAQESRDAHLLFIRNLRAKGYSDLVLEKLEAYKKNPPPGLELYLPLEIARTKIALGRDKGAEERLAIAAAAESELNEFVKKNAGKAEAAQGRLEIARLAAFQGQAWLNKALREDDPKGQKDLGGKAEEFFSRAGKELEAAVKELPAGDKMQARFDRGIVYIDQARAYINISDEKDNRRRAELIVEARKVFEGIVKEDNESPTGILAAAWLVKCYAEGDEPESALRFYKQVIGQSGAAAQPAIRWVRLFRMQSLMRDPTVKESAAKKLKMIENEGLAWLKDYPAHHNSPEGQAVRFELAENLFQQARTAAKDPKEKGTAPKLFNLAQKYYASLADTDSDFAEKANQMNMTISFMRISEKTSLDEFHTFDDCYLKAQYELFKMRDAKGDKERAGRLKEGVRALQHALSYADAKTSASKLGEVRFSLLSIYFTRGDYHRAAVAGEALAREQPPLRRSAIAAGYAIEAYAKLLPQEDNELTRERLRSLTHYVIDTNGKLWQNDPVTPVARYELAMLYQREDKFDEAIEQLEKLPASFAGYTYAQSQLAFIALKARDRADNDKRKAVLEGQARAAIARMKLSPDADPTTAYSYFLAKLENAKFIYVEAIRHLNAGEMVPATQKLIDMTKSTEQLRDEYAKLKVKLRPEAHEHVTYGAAAMDKLNRYGRAEIEYRAGNYDKVLDAKLTGDVVAQVEKLGQAQGPIRMKDFQVTGDILGLALRANVQKGETAKAKSILKLLERLAGEDGALGSSTTAVLRTLVVELNIQVKELKRQNKVDDLHKVVEKFSAFLEDYANNPGAKGLGPNEVLFLGECYESLHQHEKAAGFYAKYPPPKVLDKKIDPKKDAFTPDEERELGAYWGIQLRIAQQYRAAKKLDEAEKTLKDLKAHHNSRGGLVADMELNQILEDRAFWGAAINKWSEFMKNPALQRNLATDNRLKEMYFKAYVHHAHAWYKYSQLDKTKAAGKEKQFLRTAADYLLRLEYSANQEGWNIVRPRVEEMLAAEAPLKAQYDAMKLEYEKKKNKASPK
jgi:hypothetical protein